MSGNRFKLFLTIAFVALSAYYLYPSVRAYSLSKKLDAMSPAERTQYQEQNFSQIRETNEEALKLGLDLQGGMHVTLEVRVDELIRELATDRDRTFDQVLATAVRRSNSGEVDMVDAFVREFERRDPNARLSRYFRNPDAGITRRSSNAEVAAYLRREADEAVNRGVEIIRQRVDRFGVSEPSIQKKGTRRINVELPGIDDPERVRKLLRGTARLEFRLMAEPSELQRSLQAIIQYFEANKGQNVVPADVARADTAVAETTATKTDSAAQNVAKQTDTTAKDTALGVGGLLAGQQGNNKNQNPLLAIFQPIGEDVRFGMVAERDTAALNRMLRLPAVQQLLPPGVELLYAANPAARTEDGRELFQLLGVRRQVELTGEVITDARVEFDQMNRPEVSMVMNSEGANDWARITGANIKKPVAIVLDQYVYSFPVVQNQIVGGRSSISGLDSREEAQDIVTILKSGALPAPVDIVEERTVGPTLGASSIRAGFYSVIVGLSVVALFMIFYYKTGGFIAVLALVMNLLFIMGIMAGFNATLTLPGIAGIVLSLGMAVDANVLIYERIREEQAVGKTLKAAIDAGYSKAFTAIFDSNVTTLLTAAILYSFGVGPIRGFAVTLMAGITASMFTAIIITRIILDYMVIDRRTTHVNFG